VLCLHGLTGTPYEVRPLGEAIHRAGIRAVGPALPGHNETPQQLAELGYEAWLDAARTALDQLRRQHEVVFGVGLSMGGLLTLALAAEDAFDAAAVVGTPLRLAQPAAALVPVLRFVVPFLPKKAGSDIRDPAARARHPSYDVMPLAAVRQLQHLQRHVRGRLGRIRAPLLVGHGAHDRTARPRDAEEIAASVSSPERKRLIFENSAHIVPVDHDGEALARAITEFLGSRA